MSRHIKGLSHFQATLFPGILDNFVSQYPHQSNRYCSRSITLFCFFDHEISIKIDFGNVRFPNDFQFCCRMS